MNVRPGPVPMNSLQPCIYKDFACIQEFFNNSNPMTLLVFYLEIEQKIGTSEKDLLVQVNLETLPTSQFFAQVGGQLQRNNWRANVNHLIQM